MNIIARLTFAGSAPARFLAAAACAALLAACGGGGGGGGDDPPPVDQTPPTLTAQGTTRAVVRKGDATPLPASFAVTVGGNPGTGTVTWREGNGPALGAGGNTLSLNTATGGALAGLALGERTLTASITNPANNRTAEVSFSLLVLDASANTDDDDDGLAYDDEKTAGTQPGDGDTDDDGLADGAEGGLGKEPLVADNTGFPNQNPAWPARSLLAAEAGTSSGVQIAADGLSITFGDQINPACLADTAPFDNPIYSGSDFGEDERCFKRAVRANVGVEPGEFRYFETRRITGLNQAALQNIGQGIITPTAQIDPYCCYIDPNDVDYTTYVGGSPPAPIDPINITPPSMTVNSVGGVYARLVQVDAPFSPVEIDLAETEYYGFAVDYRGANPVVYTVARATGGAMIVSRAIDPGDFAGARAMPMLHGHPVGGAGPHAAINLGYTRFHYPLQEVRDAITALGGDGSALAGGVGIHRW